MKAEYLHQTLSSETDEFDKKFTEPLNGKSKDNWKVKSWNYCHEGMGQRTSASHIFKKKHWEPRRQGRHTSFLASTKWLEAPTTGVSSERPFVMEA